MERDGHRLYMRKGRRFPRPFTLVSIVNLTSAPCAHHAHYKLPIVHCVNNTIRADPEPIHALTFLALEPLYIAPIGELMNGL